MMEERYYIKARGIQASGAKRGTCFVVFKDSEVRPGVANYLSKTLVDLRRQCEADGTIANWKLTKDMVFNSPSTAAGFLFGANASGPQTWKDENGMTMLEHEKLTAGVFKDPSDREYLGFLKTVGGNEGSKCYYPTRLDTYGCGCGHDCRFIMMMSDIEESTDYMADFSKYTSNRNMQEYEDIMKWCRIFLTNKSFTAFKGSDVAFALLFPMEKLFESYVADKLRKYIDSKEFKMSAQDKGYHLFDMPRRFALRPDIVVTNKFNKKKVVLDTKWKLLSSNSQANYGISQSDMYQMYAYDKKYKSEKVILIYPYNNAVESKDAVYSFTATEDNPVEVRVMFYDLMDDTGSLERIANMITTPNIMERDRFESNK